MPNIRPNTEYTRCAKTGFLPIERSDRDSLKMGGVNTVRVRFFEGQDLMMYKGLRLILSGRSVGVVEDDAGQD